MSKASIRITRSAPATVGNLLTVNEPKFVSLVGKPANQRPFVVIRDDNTSNDTRVVRTARRGTPASMKNARRSDDAILALTFPSGYTKEDAESSLITFGMTGYTLSESGGVFTASRGDADLQLIAKAPSIRITSDGVMAAMNSEAYTPPTLTVQPSVSLVRFEFDNTQFDESKVSSWLAQNSVDNTQVAAQNSGDAFISVTRKEVADSIEVRRMEVDVGVIAVVAQSDSLDVPDSLAIGVVEASYGNWGWGQLDFSASMADQVFCQQMDTAADRISSVMRRIVFYSDLPLELRKTLVNTALTQYGNFINNAIDALPRQVLLLATRSDSDTQQEKQTMTTAAQKQADDAAAIKRAEDEAKAAQVTADAAQAELDARPVTRGELTSLVTAAVTAAIAAAPVTRTEEVTKPAAETKPAGEAATATGITRADLSGVLGELLAPINERLEKMESTTVVRSDSGDAKEAIEQDAKNKKTTVGSILRGSIFPRSDAKK